MKYPLTEYCADSDWLLPLFVTKCWNGMCIICVWLKLGQKVCLLSPFSVSFVLGHRTQLQGFFPWLDVCWRVSVPWCCATCHWTGAVARSFLLGNHHRKYGCSWIPLEQYLHLIYQAKIMTTNHARPFLVSFVIVAFTQASSARLCPMITCCPSLKVHWRR